MRSAPPTAPGTPRRNASPTDASFLRDARDPHVRHRGSGAHAVPRLRRHVVEAAAEPDHYARHAAIAHDQVGPEPGNAVPVACAGEASLDAAEGGERLGDQL